MTGIVGIIIRVYGLLLRLYPGSFRSEFEEQMLLDFSDMAIDAKAKGRFSFLLFCLHELVDFPINLLRAHLKEGHMFKELRSQPLNYGLRGAIGFGIGFAATAVAIWGFSSWLFSTFESQIPFFAVWVFDTFHNNKGTFLLWDILSLSSSALTGLIFGLLFALLAGHRTKYSKYMLAGGLGWFIPAAVSYVLMDSFGWSYFLSTTQNYVLGIATYALVGAFLGAIFYIAETNQKKSLQILGAGSILYPLAVYLYIKFLFYVRLEITPWFFFALITLMIILLSNVFALARAGERQMPWATVVGAIAYPILDYSIYHLAYTIMHLPTVEPGVAIAPDAFIVYELTWAGVQAFFGVLFGLLLGFVIGFQNRSNPPQLKANLL